MACFAQLRDSVPAWISDVTQLSAHVHNKRAEFAAEAAKVVVSPSSLRRQKSISSSLSTARSQRSMKPTSQGLKRLLSRESLRNDGSKRPRRVIKIQDGMVPAEVETTTTTTREAIREIESGSEIIMPRRKPAQIISYDGHAQNVLEKMVRDIWTAKSSIRSSRISSSMRMAFGGRMRMQIPAKKSWGEMIPDITTRENMEVDPAADNDNDDDKGGSDDPLELQMFMMKQRQRRNQAPQPQPKQQTRPKESPYDFVESQLEHAQNLCETAAYKFLREGNCLEELEGILRSYELVLEASTTMAEQEEEKAKAEAESREAEEANAAVAVQAADENNATAAARTSAWKTDNDPEELNAAILEVDDRSDTSEVSIDISAFRMTRYGQRTMHPFTVNRVR